MPLVFAVVMPFEDAKHKSAENTDFEARSDNTPMAIICSLI